MNSIKIREAIISVNNMILGCIPGGHIPQEIYEYRNRIHQNRINRFAELYMEGIESITEKKFNPENISTENFIDAFEIIVKKVIYTRSEEKLGRYRNVLIKEIYESSSQSDSFSKYVNLIEELNEIQILILKELEGAGKKNLIQVMRYIVCGKNSEEQMHNVQGTMDYKTYNGDIVNYDDLNFYLQELAGRGLLRSTLDPKMKLFGEAESFEVNSVGKRFLEFIKEY